MYSPRIEDALRHVYDPELEVNIVDLGLIYDIEEDEHNIHIRMTLTTPGCPLHDSIIGGVYRILQKEFPDKEINVDLVWEPRWTPERMSDEAKERLGFF